jgi:hypothetical protein
MTIRKRDDALTSLEKFAETTGFTQYRRVAVYSGACSQCGTRIESGDYITRSGNGWYGSCCYEGET